MTMETPPRQSRVRAETPEKVSRPVCSAYIPANYVHRCGQPAVVQVLLPNSLKLVALVGHNEFVSFSVDNKDCSWFAACRMDRLTQPNTGGTTHLAYTSVKVR